MINLLQPNMTINFQIIVVSVQISLVLPSIKEFLASVSFVLFFFSKLIATVILDFSKAENLRPVVAVDKWGLVSVTNIHDGCFRGSPSKKRSHLFSWVTDYKTFLTTLCTFRISSKM